MLILPYPHRQFLVLLLVCCLICLSLMQSSDALSKKTHHNRNGKSSSTTTTTTTQAPDDDDEQDAHEDDEDSSATSTTTTTTTAEPKLKAKTSRSVRKRTTARPAEGEEEYDSDKTQAPKRKSENDEDKHEEDNESEPEGESRAVRMRLPMGGVDGGGGNLDEGVGTTQSGGGYAGCGRAPLNQFTAGTGAYIINGERQKYGEFPQYIHLETRMANNMVGLCGGTLISDHQVITAAHCVKNHDQLIHASAFTVIFGEDNMRARDAHELRVGVKHICVSSKYTHDSLRYDWALITLTHPVQFNDYIQPACLPSLDQKIYTHGPQSKCFLVGAGAVGMKRNLGNSNKADAVSSTVVNKLHTENVPCMIWGFGAIDRDRVCYTRANNLNGDSCVGDSGGPILCLDLQKRWTLMASVSYGSMFCEHSRVAVYARTRTLLPEIQQQCGVKLL